MMCNLWYDVITFVQLKLTQLSPVQYWFTSTRDTIYTRNRWLDDLGIKTNWINRKDECDLENSLNICRISLTFVHVKKKDENRANYIWYCNEISQNFMNFFNTSFSFNEISFHFLNEQKIYTYQEFSRTY